MIVINATGTGNLPEVNLKVLTTLSWSSISAISGICAFPIVCTCRRIVRGKDKILKLKSRMNDSIVIYNSPVRQN